MPSRTQRDRFFRDLVAYGLASSGDLTHMYPLGVGVGSEVVNRWMTKFWAAPRFSNVALTRRLVNRFMIGADPEFCLVDPRTETRVDAVAVGLKTGQAYGADSNGRLVEVRPRPTRSALECVASLMAAMRWMMVQTALTRRMEWRCGAFMFRDGLGGHVHVGRKRPSQKAEVGALDVLAEMLLKMEVYPAKEVMERRAGDQHGQRYGVPGSPDAVRKQNHGYEYRVLPSWLDSPWMAFFNLTLAKLAIHDPDLVRELVSKPEYFNHQRAVTQLRNLLAYYKGRDDDARIAYGAMMRYGIPVHHGGDFRARWGILGMAEMNLTPVHMVPSCIRPTPEDCCEVFRYLVHGLPIPARVPEPTWKNAILPKGYYSVLSCTNTNHVKGLGELVCELVGHKGAPIAIGPVEGHETQMTVADRLVPSLPRDWRQRIAKVAPGYSVGVRPGIMGINIPGIGRNDAVPRHTLRVLLSGAFPLWHMKDVREGSFTEWANAPRGNEKAGKVVGKLIYDRGDLRAAQPPPPNNQNDWANLVARQQNIRWGIADDAANLRVEAVGGQAAVPVWDRPVPQDPPPDEEIFDEEPPRQEED